MIVGERKPVSEIIENLKVYQNVLILACGTCVTVCMSGGEKEARELAALLRLKGFAAQTSVIERQCEPEFNLLLQREIASYDVLLSLACGVGIQVLSDCFPGKPVLPGLNTTFMGAPIRQGLWEERCSGCGDCILHRFGNICPVTRCAKSLLNGPCGGSKEGKCEVKPERDCAWQLIYDRMKAQGRLKELLSIQPPKNWSFSRYGGQRKMFREDVTL
ncbi:MAG: methylenetetrahydrofolate reductase C-terminal domain-containing protein [Atribacterota bacterium]|nr:methylenetetrahydrofolate reductase C-terminal domain-containing protein [Atribacterota bacterium]